MHDDETDRLVRVVLGAGYRVVGRLDAGGMGVVYRAWDHVADRYVVVKVPRRALAADPAGAARFEREMEVARRCVHPHLVPVIDCGVHAGLPYAVMPYLAGGSLARRRPKRAGTPVAAPSASLRDWLAPVADALDRLHADGVVHRDVKPENILFDGGGSACLGDFGIATFRRQAEAEMEHAPGAVAAGLTAAGFLPGTPDYVAPEWVAGHGADGRADQYALAVVVYELLTGRKPVVGDTPAVTLAGHLTQMPPPLATLRPELPASLAAAVDRALAKTPADRFASCGAFAALALVDVPSSPPPSSPRLVCPACDVLVSVPTSFAGRNGRCPACRRLLQVAADLQTAVLPDERVVGVAAPARAGDDA